MYKKQGGPTQHEELGFVLWEEVVGGVASGQVLVSHEKLKDTKRGWVLFCGLVFVLEIFEISVS